MQVAMINNGLPHPTAANDGGKHVRFSLAPPSFHSFTVSASTKVHRKSHFSRSFMTREELRAYQRAWIKRRREQWIQEHGPCSECGSWDNPEVDHIDPAQKVTHNVWSWSKPRRENELAKCRVLCSNCHKARHAAKHGSTRKYRLGCRCAECREAHAQAMRITRWNRFVKVNNIPQEAA